MTEAYQIAATIELAPEAQGGLNVAMPSGTRSLVLEFKANNGPVTLGAEFRTKGDLPLGPGAKDLLVFVRFWADEARTIARPNKRFTVLYGRQVGAGRVDSVIENHAEPESQGHARREKAASGAA